ncbi:swift like BRCT domain [Cryptosporidium bovis]|uniref:swift like BRCT domain n=1 Tax=Cryptosporidium bovis TaxID=310047 RepID=UPI003519E6E2|nr:swift like BRCT domain [Cryptosporidium bovis]
MLFIKNCETESISLERVVGCLLVFDDSGSSVIDSITLNSGKNYIFDSVQSVFEPVNNSNNKGIISVQEIKRNDVLNIENDTNYHAIIHYEDGDFFIEDNNSIKGTYRKALNSKIKPNCKYEIISGDHIYFGDLKTKLIRYDDYDKADTPKWGNEVNDHLYYEIEEAINGYNMQNGQHSYSIENSSGSDVVISSTLVNEKNQQECNIATENQKNSESNNSSLSNFSDLLGENSGKENENINISKKRKNRYSITNLNNILSVSSESVNSDKKKIVLLWTGCTPSLKVVELTKKYNISIIDSDDFGMISEKVTHVISSSIKRTLKFLWAVSKGLPIISPSTLKNILNSMSHKINNGAINFNEFNTKCMENLLLDVDGEKKFGFSLKKSINKVQKNGPVFFNYRFFVFKSVKAPSINEINWLLQSGNSAQLISEYDSVLKIKDCSNVIIIGTNSDTKIVR